METVCEYKGWYIHDLGNGYFLIARVDEWDYEQTPFSSVDEAKGAIDNPEKLREQVPFVTITSTLRSD